MQAIHQAMIRTHQLLPSLLWKPAAPTQLLTGLNEGFGNLNSIYTFYQPLIQAATQLLQREPSFGGIPVSSKHMKRSLLPFLGDRTQLAHWHSNYKGCQCYQVKDQAIDLHTTEPARDHCSHDIDTQCHQICHPSKQTIYQHFNGCNRKDTSGYNNPLQYHTFSVQQHQLSSNHLHIRSVLANLWDSLH